MTTLLKFLFVFILLFINFSPCRSQSEHGETSNIHLKGEEDFAAPNINKDVETATYEPPTTQSPNITTTTETTTQLPPQDDVTQQTTPDVTTTLPDIIPTTAPASTTTDFQSIITPDEYETTTTVAPATTTATTTAVLDTTTTSSNVTEDNLKLNSTQTDGDDDAPISHSAQAAGAIIAFLVLLSVVLGVARKRGYLCSEYEDVYDRSTSYQHNNTPEMGVHNQTYDPL